MPRMVNVTGMGIVPTMVITSRSVSFMRVAIALVPSMSIRLGCPSNHAFGQDTTTVVMCLFWHTRHGRRGNSLLRMSVMVVMSVTRDG